LSETEQKRPLSRGSLVTSRLKQMGTGNGVCPICGGKGSWMDPCKMQTVLCYLCKPNQAEHQALARISLPMWMPDYWQKMPAIYYGPLFQIDPWLLVIHSGQTSDGVAEYLSSISDGRRVSAHISWSRSKKDFVQQVPIRNVAWHCGGSRYLGQRKLNFCSIGIELPGPWDKGRDEKEHRMLAETIACLCACVPTLTTMVGHADIDANKKDPGPGLNWHYFDDLGLKMPFVSLDSASDKQT